MFFRKRGIRVERKIDLKMIEGSFSPLLLKFTHVVVTMFSSLHPPDYFFCLSNSCSDQKIGSVTMIGLEAGTMRERKMIIATTENEGEIVTIELGIMIGIMIVIVAEAVIV